MDLRALRQFLEASRCGSFVAAAKACGVTQSAVSKSVERLERELGVQLFVRGRGGAQLTVYGHALARRAALMLEEADTAKRELGNMKSGAIGEVRIGLGLGFAYEAAPKVIAAFQRERPGVEVAVEVRPTAQLIEMLRLGRLDFALGTVFEAVLQPNDVVGEMIAKTSDLIVVRSGHPVLRADMTLEALAAYPWVSALAMSPLRNRLSKPYTDLGIEPPRISVATDSPTLVKSLIRQGDYIAFAGQEFIRLERAAGEITTIEMDEFDLTRTHWVFKRRRAIRSELALRMETAMRQEILLQLSN
ncbi:MAG: LysR family transcriptional regulator [Caulobacterales bacterium]|nr:LysR family transcriptional regulator [Caulobacterales bacterium]